MNLPTIVRPLLCSLVVFGPAAAHAQAIWDNADDRDYYGTPPVLSTPFWSYGAVALAPGVTPHSGNWGGLPYPGSGGVVSAILDAPGNTNCDVRVSLDSLSIIPGGELLMDFSSSLTVASTNVSTDGTMAFGTAVGGGAFPIFNNTGTFRKSAGAGLYSIDSGIVFNSLPGSVIQVDAGSLQLPGNDGLFDTVTFNTAAGTLIDLVDANGATSRAVFQGTLTNTTGVGTVRLSANTLSDNTSTSIPITLNFPGSVFQWLGGTIGGSYSGEVPVVYNVGTMNLSGGDTKYCEAFITNKNLMVQSGAGNFDIRGDTVTNAAGATYDLQSDAGIVTTYYGAFANAGLFKKSAGTGTSTINTYFRHQGGTVEVDSGTLQLPTVQDLSGVSTGATFVVAPGAALDLGSGERSVGTYTGSGGGVVRFSAGTFPGDIHADVSQTTINFPGAMFQWTGGTLGDYPSELFINAGTMNLSGDSGVSFIGQFTNAGTMIQTGAGSFKGGGLQTLNNAAGALFDLHSDAGITRDGVNYAFNFTNAGTLQKSAGAGTSTVLASFTNTGTVLVETGTLDFSGDPPGLRDGMLPSGIWNVSDGATLSFSGYPNGITINQADVTLDGPNALFPAIDSLSDNQGNFSLLGQRQFTTKGDLSNEGTITLDAGSTVHVTGNFTASETPAPVTSTRHRGPVASAVTETGSVLRVVVGGTASQGAQSAGLLQVNGTATLAGRLEIVLAATVASLNPSETVTVMAAEALAGGFSNVTTGARLATADGKGSFKVTASEATANRVVLSDFLPAGQIAAATPVVTFSVPRSANGKTTIVEGGPKLKVLATRSGDDLSQPLTVIYKTSGSAAAGVDYKALSGMAVIPAGEASVKIKVLPYNDGVADGVKMLKLKLQPSDAYTFGAVTKAKITILDAQ